MRIGVVSDTHLNRRNSQLPTALAQGLQGVEFILHAGDWVDLSVLQLFENIAPVDGVAGNNDGIDIENRFGRSKILLFHGFRIGLVHGDGYARSTEERAWDTFRQDPPDIIIFGHSHVPYRVYRDGVLLFNPGSPTDKRRQPLYSYGIIELTETIQAEHKYYANKI